MPCPVLSRSWLGVTTEFSPIQPERDGRSVVTAGLETFGLRALLLLVGFTFTVVVSRVLGPEGRGIYYVPIIASVVLMSIAKLALEQANIFLVGARQISLERLAAQNLVVALFAGSAAAALLVAAPVVLPTVFADVPVVLLVLAGVTIPFSIHTQFTAGLQNLAGQIAWQFRAGIIGGLAQVGLILLLNATGGVTLTSVMLATLVGLILTWALTVMRSGIGYMRLRWDGPLLRETLAQSLVLHVGMLLLFLHFRVDMFMVKGIIGATALGQYSLAVVLAETVLVAPDSIAMAVLPKQIGTTVKTAAGVALRAARLNMVVAAVVGIGWALMGSAVIGAFFGAEFLPAFEPLLALLPAMVFLSMQRACSAAALRAGKPALFTLIYAGTLGCNIVLNLVWIPAFGGTGAALASTLSYAVSALLFLIWTSRLANVPLLVALCPTATDFEPGRSLILDALERLRHTGHLPRQRK